MRPLTVRRVCSSRPLSWRRLPVSGCSGGGKSRLRGIEAELNGGLVGGLSQVGEEVADLLFAGVDNLPRWSVVDGVGDLVTQTLEAIAQLIQQSIRRELGLGVHRFLQGAGQVRVRTDDSGCVNPYS